MAFYPQCRITYKGKHRLHDRLNNLLIINAAVVIATHYLLKGEANFEYGSISTFACQEANLEVRVPISGPLEVALLNKFPDEIRVEFHENRKLLFSEWAAGLGRSEPMVWGLVAATANMIVNIFVEFYEAYSQFIHDRYRKAESYPPLWRFARVVRNSISHGCRVSINSAKESPVEWCKLKYSFADNGRPIIGVAHADLSIGDILVLMFEMSDLLDAEGCRI
jgi:hypothetical protein